MPRFVLGFLVGGLCVAGGFLALAEFEHEAPREAETHVGPTPSVDAESEVEEVAHLEGVRPASPAVEIVDDGREEGDAWPEGEIVLAIGDGYTFENERASPSADPSKFDIYCQDIRYEASLACRLGAGPARAPFTSVGLPSSPLEAAGLVADAPEYLPERNLTLKMKTDARDSGLGFVQAANGRTYRLALKSIQGHTEALRRTARIVYQEVPRRRGGGEFSLPHVDGATPLGEPARVGIRTASALGEALPRGTGVQYIAGNYEKLRDMRPETDLRKQGHYALEKPLRDKITFSAGGGIWAEEGVTPEGEVRLTQYSAFGTQEDMDGTVENRSYAYMFVGGDLNGLMHVKSYASVVILGDIRGTLKVRSYTSLYLKGRVLGSLDCKGSCWSTFYLDGHWTEDDLVALGDAFRSVTLHVRSSDLSVGEHKGVGSWRQVIVGDKVWSRFDHVR